MSRSFNKPFGFLMKIPFEIEGKEFRSYLFVRSCVLLTFYAHLIFLPVFIWVGNPAVLQLNVLAVFIDVFALFLISRKLVNTATLMLFSYIVFYCTYCLYVFGLDGSFSLYYLVLISFIFMSSYKLTFKILLSLGVVLVFCAMVLFLLQNPDTKNLTASKELFLNLINLIASGIFISLVVINYTNSNRLVERDLCRVHDSKEKLYSIIAHDLRGPISSVSGLADILVKLLKKEGTNTRLTYYAGVIATTTKDTNVLLENLLGWSRNQKGEFSANIKKVDMYKVFQACIELHLAQIEQKTLKVINQCDENVFCNCDEKMVKTIFRNILSNAIKFNRQRGEIKISVRRSKSYNVFIIEDSGMGMSQKLLKEVFLINNEKVRLGTNNEKGTGLGLMLCKQLVEKNHGRIWVESGEGIGTKVYVRLPVVKTMHLVG